MNIEMINDVVEPSFVEIFFCYRTIKVKKLDETLFGCRTLINLPRYMSCHIPEISPFNDITADGGA